nr:hypothetical protein [uncultured Shimia sp.]
MHKRSLIVSVVAGSLIASVAAAQFGYIPWRVNQLPGKGNFEVIEGAGSGNQRYWCEAAKYAVGPLRSRGNVRMYILNPEGPAKTQGNSYAVGFTLNPSQAVLDAANKPGDGGNYSVSVSKVGYNLSVSHAHGFCTMNVLF